MESAENLLGSPKVCQSLVYELSFLEGTAAGCVLSKRPKIQLTMRYCQSSLMGIEIIRLLIFVIGLVMTGAWSEVVLSYESQITGQIRGQQFPTRNR